MRSLPRVLELKRRVKAVLKGKEAVDKAAHTQRFSLQEANGEVLRDLDTSLQDFTPSKGVRAYKGLNRLITSTRSPSIEGSVVFIVDKETRDVRGTRVRTLVSKKVAAL